MLRISLVVSSLAVIVPIVLLLSFSPSPLSKDYAAILGIVVGFSTLSCSMLSGYYAEVELNRSGGWWGFGALFIPFLVPILLAFFVKHSQNEPFEFSNIQILLVAGLCSLTLFGTFVYMLSIGVKPGVFWAFILLAASIVGAGSCGSVADDEDSSTVFWAVAGLLFPYISPFIYASLLFGRSRSISDKWRCPHCDSVLEKGNKALIDYIGNASIVGVATCGVCEKTVAQSDVYLGKYDLA